MSISVFSILVLLVSLTVQASAVATGLAKPNCTEKCGNVAIPFPFGIGAGCYLDDWHEIVCEQKNTVPKLRKIGLQVLKISFVDDYEFTHNRIIISLPLIYSNSCEGKVHGAPVSFKGSPFVFSQESNVFTSVSCNTLATLKSTESAVFGCKSKCAGNNTDIGRYSTCSGKDACCQTALPFNLQSFSVDFRAEGGPQGCGYAFLADSSWFLRDDFTGLYDLSLNDTVPVVLDWGISNTSDYELELIRQSQMPTDPVNCTRYSTYGNYLSAMPIIQCRCSYGYSGNPYFIGGCQGNILHAILFRI